MHKYGPVDPKNLTKKQRMDALNSIMFLIEKRTGDVKARFFADARKKINQKEYRKEDATSPT